MFPTFSGANIPAPLQAVHSIYPIPWQLMQWAVFRSGRSKLAACKWLKLIIAASHEHAPSLILVHKRHENNILIVLVLKNTRTVQGKLTFSNNLLASPGSCPDEWSCRTFSRIRRRLIAAAIASG